MKKKKIDWVNHSIAFISTLLGIFIAFQLDDWQENRSQRERMKMAIAAIKIEIENNLQAYRNNVKILRPFVTYSDFVISHSQDGKLYATENEIKKMESLSPERFRDVIFLRKKNDSINIYNSRLSIDVIPITIASSSNWEAAKASGVLLLMSHDQLTKLTQIYDWIEKDVGMKDYYKNTIKGETFDDVDAYLKSNKIILRESEIKLGKIEELLVDFKWN